MDVAFQNTRGAVNAALRRLAKFTAIVEFIADEYDELQRDGTYGPASAFTLEYRVTFSAKLTPEQIQRLAAGGLTVTNGASVSIPEALDRNAQRVYIDGAWWRVVEQSVSEGATVLTIDLIAAEPGGVYE